MARKFVEEPEMADRGAHTLSLTIASRTAEDMKCVADWKGIPLATHIRQVVEAHHENPAYGALVRRAKEPNRKTILEAIAELAEKEGVSVTQLKKELLADE